MLGAARLARSVHARSGSGTRRHDDHGHTYCYRPIAIDIDAMVDFGRSTKFEIVQQRRGKNRCFQGMITVEPIRAHKTNCSLSYKARSEASLNSTPVVRKFGRSASAEYAQYF